MTYLLLFLEGILTFISPCLLPMIPLYLAYFTAQDESKSTFKEALKFVLGFSVVFIAMSVFVSTIGKFIIINRQTIQVVTGLLLVLLGIDQLLGHRFSQKIFRGMQTNRLPLNPFIFGMLFAVSWTPCVGVYLASAMALALNADHQIEAVLRIMTYALGLGIPFILSALFINESKDVLQQIKKHTHLIQTISAILLIGFGLLIATGYIYQVLPV